MQEAYTTCHKETKQTKDKKKGKKCNIRKVSEYKVFLLKAGRPANVKCNVEKYNTNIRQTRNKDFIHAIMIISISDLIGVAHCSLRHDVKI